MRESTRISIRQIFLNPRPFVALMRAAGLLGISFQTLKREIAEGTIVAERTGMGVRVPRREMMAAAMRTWTHEIIEEALGEDAPRVLPEAIRLVALNVRVPRYQRDMVRYVAERDGTTVSDVVARELEGMASAERSEVDRDESEDVIRQGPTLYNSNNVERFDTKPDDQNAAPERNRRARGRRIAMPSSPDDIIREEVEDALAATPEERMEALIALLDSVYQLWAVRGLDRDEGLCRFPRITQQRRRGLCSDRGDGGTLAHSVSNDA